MEVVYVTTGNNHRLIGQKLDLFHFQDDAAGSVFWHPNGAIIFSEIEKLIRRVLDGEYDFVKTPQLFRPDMWKISGHWDHYRNNMFMVGEDMLLKPMNCPAHIEIFRHRNVSHRDLPLRYAEFGICHRNEPSGALNGLMRLRQFTQDDGHIFCMPDQIESEIQRFCSSVVLVYNELGFEKIEAQISLRPDSRTGSDEDWDIAEQSLISAVRASGIAFNIVEGEGAFYGPKLEFSLRDSMGRSWQCGTAQLDFFLPKKFGIEVMMEKHRANPVMIHRAILGSIERFIGIMLEHHGVKLPVRYKPIQAAILPLSDEFVDYAYDVASGLRARSIRCIVDNQGNVAKRVQRYQSMGIDILVVGERERSDHSVNLRGVGKISPDHYLV